MGSVTDRGSCWGFSEQVHVRMRASACGMLKVAKRPLTTVLSPHVSEAAPLHITALAPLRVWLLYIQAAVMQLKGLVLHKMQIVKEEVLRCTEQHDNSRWRTLNYIKVYTNLQTCLSLLRIPHIQTEAL